MKEIKISVIIPCYNDGKYLKEAVRSVKKYDSDDYEIIIIDDGSSDRETREILDYLSKLNCRVFRQKHKGPCSARNLGIEKAQGKYLLFLDADNKIKPEYIKEGVKILEKNPRIGVVYSDKELFGKETGIRKMQHSIDLSSLLERNRLDMCALVRKKACEEIGGFDENLDSLLYEDWVFWIDLYLMGWKFYHIPKALFYYRVRDNSRNNLEKDKRIMKKFERYFAMKYAPLIYREYKKYCREYQICKAELEKINNSVGWKFFKKLMSLLRLRL